MIFVTVGTQLPFDRLIQALDQWVSQCAPRPQVFAQIGPDGREPAHLDYVRTMTPQQFAEKLETATIVVAHAGMGTILSALEIGKKVVVLPRKAELGEHRNDHQLATAKKLGDAGMVEVAADEHRLIEMLSRMDASASTGAISADASEPLLAAVRQFIFQGVPVRDHAASCAAVASASAPTASTKATLS